MKSFDWRDRPHFSDSKYSSASSLFKSRQAAILRRVSESVEAHSIMIELTLRRLISKPFFFFRDIAVYECKPHASHNWLVKSRFCMWYLSDGCQLHEFEALREQIKRIFENFQLPRRWKMIHENPHLWEKLNPLAHSISHSVKKGRGPESHLSVDEQLIKIPGKMHTCDAINL
jgi:hypothetical protein